MTSLESLLPRARKCTRMGLYHKHMLSPSSLLSKIIGVPTRNGWGKMEPASLSCRQYVSLEHGSCLHSFQVGDISSCFSLASVGLGDPFLASHLLFASSSWPLIFWCQILPNPVSCCRYVQEKLTSTVSTLLWFSTDPDSQKLCSSVSCRWCGKHYGPPSIKVTSFRLQLII